MENINRNDATDATQTGRYLTQRRKEAKAQRKISRRDAEKKNKNEKHDNENGTRKTRNSGNSRNTTVKSDKLKVTSEKIRKKTQANEKPAKKKNYENCLLR